MDNRFLENRLKKNGFKYWLIGLITLALIVIAVGGITRLTRSGLSIADWRPIVGIIPPLSENAWTDEFEKYKATPEYRIVNNHFELADYKAIFIWEYLHRLLGRLLFLYTLIGGLYLWKSEQIPIHIPLSLSVYIAFQGLIGWLMVKSGLQTEPLVSPFILSVHYFLALGLLVYAYYFLCLLRPAIKIKKTPIAAHLQMLIGISLGVQIFYGCLMSGFKAGHLSDTFPLVNNELIPRYLFDVMPSFLSLVKNPFIIHWLHRWLGIFTFVLIVLYVIINLKRTTTRVREPFLYFLGLSSLQILFGIALVIFGSPKMAAVTHQILAALIALAYSNIVFRSKA